MTQTAEAQDWIPEDTFGARLALVRQHRGWNTTQAADAAGLNDQSWRNWEHGKSVQRFELVCRKIAAASGCSLTWLLQGGELQRFKTGRRKHALSRHFSLVAGGGDRTAGRAELSAIQ